MNTLEVVSRGLERQKVGIELGSCELYPNYPNSLGMFQTKAQKFDLIQKINSFKRKLRFIKQVTVQIHPPN